MSDADIIRKDAFEQAYREGYLPPGEVCRRGDTGDVAASTVVAKRLGYSESTIRAWLCKVKGTKHEPSRKLWKGRAIETPEMRNEARNADFWRNRAKLLERQLADAEHIAEQLAGLREQTFTIPTWVFDKGSGKAGKSVVGLALSDVHCGEVVSADELLGLNAYDTAICRKRLMRLINATCEIPERWTSDCSNQGLLLLLLGDLISGDIREELRRTNELTANEQHRFMVEEMTGAIRLLKSRYKRVHVVSVPGNHGRQTEKPTSKLYGRLSYDTLTAQSIADRFSSDNAVTFQIEVGRDAVVPILGHTVFATHGDGMGTGGGQGFIGPLAPIARGTKKVEAQQASINRKTDLIVHGHYHFSANPHEGLLSNGSVVGYSEYPNGMRASVESPMQWLFLLHERWKLRERLAVKLEDLPPKELPRVRVPAKMAEA